VTDVRSRLLERRKSQRICRSARTCIRMRAMIATAVSLTVRPLLLLLLAAGCVVARDRSGASTVGWKPITANERSMTSAPGAPGAPAVRLFSEVFTDDTVGQEHHYERIKVLKEEGRSYGNLQIPYVKGSLDVTGLEVRMIQPDGGITENPIAPIESVIRRYRRIKTSVKTLALPAVQIGTIIEYQYDFKWNKQVLISLPWLVYGDLYTLRASFVRRPTRMLNLRWYGSRLPKGVEPSCGPDGLIRLELKDVPAAEEEDFMPPESETRPRVDFYYYGGKVASKDTDEAWAGIAKSAYESTKAYIAKDRGLDELLAGTVKADDPSEVKLRKLYDRVQAMRNLSFEAEKTTAEFKRERLKPPENVGELIKLGYGWQGDLDMLYLALARRAGFEAWLLDVARRDGEVFFDPRGLLLLHLPGRAVLVRVNGKDYFLDPGTVLLPFGWLPWGETSVQALRLDAATGGLLMTPKTGAAESAVERKAKLDLDENGTLQGEVTVTYSGLEAFNRRFDARDLDAVEKRRILESELQRWIPGSAEAQLQNQPDWSRADPTLTAVFSVRAKDWATVLNRRLLFPERVFSGVEREAFYSETRVHDLYFPFPQETRDTIEIVIPGRYRIESIPPVKERDLGYMSYRAVVEWKEASIQISRRVTQGRISLPVSAYDAVLAFYQDLRLTDEAQIVLTSGAALTR